MFRDLVNEGYVVRSIAAATAGKDRGASYRGHRCSILHILFEKVVEEE